MVELSAGEYAGVRSSQSGAKPSALATFVICSLLVLMVAGPYLTFKTLPYTGEGSPLRQLLYIALYAIALIAYRVDRDLRRLIPSPLGITLALTYFWFSLIWALDLDIAVRRLLLTTMIPLIIFSAVNASSYAIILKWIRIIFALLLVVNFATVLLAPSIGIHQDVAMEGFGLDPGIVGTWKGVMGQKNFAGAVCALTILVYVLDASSINTFVRVIVVLASSFFLVKSGAKTSLGIILVCMLIGVSFQIYNPRFRVFRIAAVGVGIGVISLVFYIYRVAIFAYLHRPDAFTGRIQIWGAMIAYWQDHPFGSGFGSFWNIGADAPMSHYAPSASWLQLVPIGHNGYLDLLVQTGIPGLVLAVLGAIVFPIARLTGTMSVPRRQGSLLLAMLLFCAIHNVTETSMFDRDDIVEVMFMFSIALIYKITPRPVAVNRPRGF